MSDREASELDRLQRWMLDVITHPNGVHAGIDSESARQTLDVDPQAIETVITRSEALDSFQRLDVYANAYFSRLLECMRSSFPALVDGIGEDAFDTFSFGYLQTYPPTSYTLNNLAVKFVDYLEETRPEATTGDTGDTGEETKSRADERAGGRDADWSDFVIDLARLEETFDIVFDGPGIEEDPVDPNWAESLQADTWESTRLEIVPCLRLMDFRFPVNQYYTAWRNGETPQPSSPSNSYLAVTRRDYIVRRFELEKHEYQLLVCLANGQSIGEAINAVVEDIEDVDSFSQSLHAWFQRWTKLGFFCGAKTSFLPGQRPGGLPSPGHRPGLDKEHEH